MSQEMNTNKTDGLTKGLSQSSHQVGPDRKGSERRRGIPQGRIVPPSKKTLPGTLSSGSSVTDIRTKLAEALESPFLQANLNLLFILHTRFLVKHHVLQPRSGALDPASVRGFLADAFQLIHQDPGAFAYQLQNKATLAQFQKIMDAPFRFEVSQQVHHLDFQTCLVPLLFILAHPEMSTQRFDVLRSPSHALLDMARTALPTLLGEFCRCIDQALAARTLVPPSLSATTLETLPFFPHSFAQVFYPIVKCLEIVLRKFERCTRQADILRHIQRLEVLLLSWTQLLIEGGLVHTCETKHAQTQVLDAFQRVKAWMPLAPAEGSKPQVPSQQQQAVVSDATTHPSDTSELPQVRPPREQFNNDAVDFRDIRIVPTRDELLFQGDPCLPYNLQLSPAAHWLAPGPQRLLDTHFRLLRRDMVSLLQGNVTVFAHHLKKGVKFRDGPFTAECGGKQADLMVYTNVEVVRALDDNFYGECYEVMFDWPKRLPKPSPKQAKKKPTGFQPKNTAGILERDGLVCLIYRDTASKHAVQLHCGVVAVQPRKKDPNSQVSKTLLTVSFSESNFNPLALKFRDIYLIEFTDFLLESYRAVLLELQMLHPLDLPFPSVLCPAFPPAQNVLQVGFPNYLGDRKLTYSFEYLCPTQPNAGSMQKAPVAQSSPRVEANTLEPFCPQTDNIVHYALSLVSHTTLHGSQAHALLAALTSNVCCIQGPPGTGKSFIGVQIVKALLQIPEQHARILVMSHTNHAIDQFLTHLAKEGFENLLHVSSSEIPELVDMDWNLNFRGTQISPRLLSSRIRSAQCKLSKLRDRFNEPVDFAGVWHFLRKHEPITFKNLLWPFNATEEDHTPLVYWLKNKDPPTTSEDTEVAKGAAGQSPSCAVPKGTMNDGFKPDIPLEELMNQLTLTSESEKKRLTPLASLITAQSSVIVPAPTTRFAPEKTAPAAFQHTEHISIWDMTLSVRKCKYNEWKQAVQSLRKRTFELEKGPLEESIRSNQRWFALNMIFKKDNVQIIGLTTTKAAKHKELLKAWLPNIVICEEAGEVLEAHILATLSQSTQQLILIGDHKQLRPRIEDDTLGVESPRGKGKYYRLDVSLFERLMDPACHVPRYMLQEQRRMKPVISQFIRYIYPELTDGENTTERPSIRGMLKDVFFMSHSQPQSSKSVKGDGAGHVNEFEVDMVVATLQYLLKQGYARRQIAVLTPYNAQLALLESRISKVNKTGVVPPPTDSKDSAAPTDPAAEDLVRVRSVDSFQGEESDIVLISLVRSTFENGSDRGIGFLKQENRLNVLLSRARNGMYLFGNAPLIAESSELWKKIIDTMTAQNLLGDQLPMACPSHPKDIRYAKLPADLEALSPLGGCLKTCDYLLPCGHTCKRICHAMDSAHETHKCVEPCKKRHRSCGHPCPKLCHEDCGKCEVMVDATGELPCGHHIEATKCYTLHERNAFECQQEVKYQRITCEHHFKIPCYLDPEEYMLQHPCKQMLSDVRPQCNHPFTYPCHVDQDLFLKMRPCSAQVDPVVLPKCGHFLPNPLCHQLGNLSQVQCKVMEKLTFECGHTVSRTCAETQMDNACPFKCQKKRSCHHTCATSCKDHEKGGACPPCHEQCLKTACDHTACIQPCFKPCNPCINPCTWACKHQGACPYPCGYPCVRLPCDLPCEKSLVCGHPCPSVCGEPCPTPKACVTCAKSLAQKLSSFFNSEGLPNGMPLIFLKCRHSFPFHTLDAHFEMHLYYEKQHGKWSSIKYPKAGGGKRLVCPECQYPVRVKDTRRYSRILKLSILQSADAAALNSFSSILRKVSVSISNFERAEPILPDYQIRQLEENFDAKATCFMDSTSNALATKMLQSSTPDASHKVIPYPQLYSAFGYSNLHGDYCTIKGRLKLLTLLTSNVKISIMHYKRIRVCMNEALEHYSTARKHFELSNATSSITQLSMEVTFAKVDFFTLCLEFFEAKDFCTLDAEFQRNELERILHQVKETFYSLPELKRDIIMSQIPGIQPCLESYSAALYQFTKVFEMKRDAVSGGKPGDPKTYSTLVQSLFNLQIPKFRLSVTTSLGKFFSGKY